jgi:multiple sugar transport system substrate-binding protein
MLLVDNWGGLNPPVPAYNTEKEFVDFAPEFNEKFAKLVPVGQSAPANADYKVWAYAFLQATEALVLKPKETSVDDAVKMMTNYVSTQLDPNKAEARK